MNCAASVPAAHTPARLSLALALTAQLSGCSTAALTLDAVKGDYKPAETTRLMMAAGRGHEAVVKRAISQGEDLNAVSEHEWTPLHFAAEGASARTAGLLIENGADPNVFTDYLYTPLHLAAQRNSADVARVLVEHGAHVDTVDWFSLTPLHYAARAQNEELVDYLLRRGAAVKPATEPASAEDRLATAYSYRAQATFYEGEGRHSETETALAESRSYYLAAADGFDQLAELTRRKLRNEQILERALPFINMGKIVLAQFAATHQAKRQAKTLAEINSLRGKGGTVRGYGYQLVFLLGSRKVHIQDLENLLAEYRTSASDARLAAYTRPVGP
jgi:hypothetical protein